MSNPRPVAFPLLKLGLPGRGPCNKWFADSGKMHHVHDARRSNEASLDVSPRFPLTGPQTFAANIAFVGFGGGCLGNRHEPDIQGVGMGSRREAREDLVAHNGSPKSSLAIRIRRNCRMFFPTRSRLT